jgi:hypothetical protein
VEPSNRVLTSEVRSCSGCLVAASAENVSMWVFDTVDSTDWDMVASS